MADTPVVNFGCRLNSFESEQIGHLVDQVGRDDLIVVNSCAVTNETERQVRQKVRQLVRQNPDKTVAVVGCAAELNPQSFAEIPGVSLVLGNAEKLEAHQYREDTAVSVGKARSTNKSPLDIRDFHAQTARTRAHVMIQNGCDHDCTFCAITIARGDSRSVPMAELINHIQKLVQNNVQEVVLSGVDISAYGADFEPQVNLGQLVQRILSAIPDLPRLRLSSIDCIELDPLLMDLIVSEKRIMPHLHLSLQAGDDMILKRMKRRHSRQQAVDLCQTLEAKRPELVFGADLIAGFPTETAEMFGNSLDLISDCNLTYLHVFPFSARSGTPAARIPKQVAGDERKRRAKALRTMGNIQLQRFLQSKVNSEQEILIENQKFGRTPHYAPVHFEQPLSVSEGIVRAKITSCTHTHLIAKAQLKENDVKENEDAA